MNDERKLQLAQKTYGTLVDYLNERNWNFDAEEDKLGIEFYMSGDDLRMHFRIFIDVPMQCVVLYSPMPFHMPEEHITAAALALSYINDRLLDGCFDLDLSNGRICFRQTFTFYDSLIGRNAFDQMIYAASHIVDDFNDQLLMLSKGAVTLSQFVAYVDGLE